MKLFIKTTGRKIKSINKIIYILLILAIIFIDPLSVDCSVLDKTKQAFFIDKENLFAYFSQKNSLMEYTPVILSEKKLAEINEKNEILANNSQKEDFVLSFEEKQYIIQKNKVVRLAINSNSPIDLKSAEKEYLAEQEEMKLWVLNEVKKAGLDIKEAEIIIACESRWQPDAIGVNKNGTYDVGLWQINSIHKDISNADKMDYKAATKWAIEKRLKDGSWKAWSCSRKLYNNKKL